MLLKFTVLAVVFYQAQCGGYGHGHSIPAAIKSRYSVEIKPVHIQQEEIKPQMIDVGPQNLPVTIHFRSMSSNLKVLQSHQGAPGDVQKSSSEDEPHQLYHEVHKPVMQEVREIITPYRRITQEIRPVQEDIQTLVAKGQNRGMGGGGGGGYGGGYGGGKGGGMSYGGGSGQHY